MEAEIAIPTWAARIASDYTDMDRDPKPVDARKVSAMRLTLPDDVYFEYAFIDEEGRMRADPDNPVSGANPWYPEVSALLGPQYTPSRYARLPDEIASGTLDRHRLQTGDGGPRRVTVYTPVGGEGRTLPLVVVFDGVAFLRLAGLPRVLEALLAEGAVQPARLAFIEPGDRTREYGFNESYRDFILDEMLPFLEESYPTGPLFACGASLGGLMSAQLALLAPDRFAGLATFSGAFLGAPEDRDFYRSRESWVLQRLQEEPPSGLRWYAEVGTIEWLTEINREVSARLSQLDVEHDFRERNAGHNWTNWRNGLAHGLRFLLGDS